MTERVEAAKTDHTVWMNAEYPISIGRQIGRFDQFEWEVVAKVLPNGQLSYPSYATTSASVIEFYAKM